MTHRQHTEADVLKALRSISPQDFRNFGMQQIAYIRMLDEDQKKSYAIYSADGTRLSIMGSLEEAIVAARYNDLEPVTVH